MKVELKQKKSTSSQNQTDVTESEGDNWTFQFFQTKYILPLFMSCFLSILDWSNIGLNRVRIVK